MRRRLRSIVISPIRIIFSDTKRCLSCASPPVACLGASRERSPASPARARCPRLPPSCAAISCGGRCRRSAQGRRWGWDRDATRSFIRLCAFFQNGKDEKPVTDDPLDSACSDLRAADLPQLVVHLGIRCFLFVLEQSAG